MIWANHLWLAATLVLYGMLAAEPESSDATISATSWHEAIANTMSFAGIEAGYLRWPPGIPNINKRPNARPLTGQWAKMPRSMPRSAVVFAGAN